MAVTIDHLRVEHRITVLQEFTDLAGIRIPAGDSGILRAQGMDSARMEIWIDFERVASRDTLRFALRATEGPRNGHMREFFEMGDAVDSIPVNTAPSRESPATRSATEHAETQEPTLPGFHETPPHGTSIDQRSVACSCDPWFHRPLLAALSENAVHACLRCGTVTCTRSIGDDGRFTGEAWFVNRTVELSRPSLKWLAEVPRIKVDYASTGAHWPIAAEFARYPTLYYPADSRCRTREELTELESTLVRQQAGRSVAECLRAACRMRTAPPADLSSTLRGYDHLWTALHLRADAEVSVLLQYAQPGVLGGALATDVLLQRADTFQVMSEALRSSDDAMRRAGFSMARDMTPVDPRIADLLVDLLSTLTLEPSPTVPGQVVSHARFSMLFLLAAEVNVSSPRLLAALRALMRPLARRDATLVDYVRIAVREQIRTARP